EAKQKEIGAREGGGDAVVEQSERGSRTEGDRHRRGRRRHCFRRKRKGKLDGRRSVPERERVESSDYARVGRERDRELGSLEKGKMGNWRLARA
ncbi:hypothetical protein ACLOJK_027483, partial [Asimina triloba]